MKELKITKEFENPLFQRKEVLANIESEVVPKLSEAAEMISKKFSIPIDAIKIKKVSGKFGSRIFEIEAHVYDSKQSKEEIEVKTKQEKQAEAKAIEEAKKAAEEERKAKEEAAKAAEEAKASAENPVEEVKSVEVKE